MFSVVIPLYNKEKAIKRAIHSVLNQTVQEFEIVVVDDGSTDGGSQIVQRIQDSRIRLIYQENEGVSAARNRGIAEARFDLIAFIDADDEWKPEFLETVARLVQDFPEAAVFATGYLYCEGSGLTREPRLRGIPLYPWEGIIEDYFAVAAESDPPIFSSAVAIRKDALLAVGGFPVGVTSGEDLLTWAKLAAKNKVAFSREHLGVFKVSVGKLDSGRIVDLDDRVGQGLAKLLRFAENRKSLRRYLALWHRMRASTFFRHGMQARSFIELVKSLYFDHIRFKTYLLLSAAIIPYSSRLLPMVRYSIKVLGRRKPRCGYRV